MRKTDIGAFSKTFSHAVRNDRFAFFLGAGCSATSGVPSGSTLCLTWIRELKRRETGSALDAEAWYAARRPGFRPEAAGRYFVEVMQELFQTERMRKTEVERIVSNRDPGFGYAALAGVLTDPTVGRNCNVVLTTNFDDLVGDALLLYSNVRPMVIAHELVADLSEDHKTRPLVLKLHGDAILGTPRSTREETNALPEGMKRSLGRILNSRGLVFMGYSGCDRSVLEALESLSTNVLLNGVWWVGRNLPAEPAFTSWLEKCGAIWVEHGSFDEAMAVMQGDLHLEPPVKRRLSRLTASYEASRAYWLRRARGNVAAGNDDAEVTAFIERFWKTARKEREDVFAAAETRFASNAKFKAFHAQWMRQSGRLDLARSLFEESMRLDPDDASSLCRFASFLTARDVRACGKGGHDDEAEALVEHACRANPYSPMALGTMANFLVERVRREKREDEPGAFDAAHDFYQMALQQDPSNPETLGSYADYLWRTAGKRSDATAEAIEFYERAVRLKSNSYRILGNFSQILFVEGHEDRAIGYAATVIASAPNKTLVLESLFYLFVHKPDHERNALKRMARLFARGVRSPDWDLGPTVAWAQKAGDGRLPLIRALQDVVGDRSSPAILDQFSSWKA